MPMIVAIVLVQIPFCFMLTIRNVDKSGIRTGGPVE